MTTFERQQLCFRCRVCWIQRKFSCFCSDVHYFSNQFTVILFYIHLLTLNVTLSLDLFHIQICWRKCSRKRLLNDFIQAYLINFCSIYIYKMNLFILLLIIMFICCLMAEVRVEARGRGITVTGVIMKWWHEVGIDDWYTGPWISRFSLLLLFTLALTVLTKCTWSQLRYFLSIKKISIDC